MANAWLNGRTMAAFAGGTFAAILASRFLPPVVAQTVGAARAMADKDPFEGLIKDHRKFVDLLHDMQQATSSVHRTQLLLRLKRGLTRHALAEEDVVYPMLHDLGREPHDVESLYHDHAEMKMSLHRLEMMLKDDPRWLGEVRDLTHLVETHARHEEGVDFPRLRRMLDDSDLAQLSRSLYREKAMVL